ncbi:MAG: GNAT family N-acetyltransferase [Emticicia sp.]|nr:GNAT family N-acetyltransferase [Emticicia sp.]
MQESTIQPIITTVKSDDDVRGILALQQKNLKKNLTPEQIQSQGFVTVEHQFSVLKAMNDAQPSVIVKDGETVVAYCLAMLPQFRNDVPILKTLFDAIDEIDFEEKKLKDYQYVVMGQVCVGESYRSMGFFDGMYQKLREELSAKFEMCVTDISTNNTRSLKAHARVGFIPVKDFEDKNLNEIWRVVVWDWKPLPTLPDGEG